MEIILTRLESDENGTFGQITVDGEIVCVTCEDPWNDNHTGDSCIPEGTYNCVPHHSPKYPDVWEVTKVPGRIAILIHNGNTIDDTRGCILVGSEFGTVGGKKAVINSVNTLHKLKTILPDNFVLTICTGQTS